ncbi:MAG: polyprenyl synthetase family protein [Haloplasmataceae bacterium]|jgi:heptaprenyl diphosphate synthase|nr:polyprenyl synthetase family protein [Haloplasmataceae bacterium]
MDLFNLCNVNKELLDEELKNIIVSDDLLEGYQKDLLLKLILSSGKRIRPIFTVVGSKLGPAKVDNIYRFAALFELVHTVSLIHDDVIDNADTRRNIPTLHKLTDEITAIMLGNYLLSRCAELVTENNLEQYYYENLHLTDLCKSEIMQQDLLFNFDITIDEYIEKTKNKTALLIAASFIAGAKLANADQKTLKHLYTYSLNLGISFQIIDDILDFTQSSSKLGKPAGQDLMNGNITIPVIYALRDKKLKEHIRALTIHSSVDDFTKCINDILNSKVIEKSKLFSQRYLKKARLALEKINYSDKYVLKKIINELESRTY